MIINHHSNIVFIHNPHAGGNAIKRWMNNNLNNNKTIKPIHRWVNQVPEGAENYFKFGVMRNPWEWICSLYGYTIKTNGRWDKEKFQFLKNNEFNFNKFVNWILDSSKKEKFPILKGQYRWFFSDRDEVDLLLLMENGKYYKIDKLSEFLNKKAINIPLVNKSSHNSISNMYNKETKELVRDFFSKDIEIGNFTFYE